VAGQTRFGLRVIEVQVRTGGDAGRVEQQQRFRGFAGEAGVRRAVEAGLAVGVAAHAGVRFEVEDCRRGALESAVPRGWVEEESSAAGQTVEAAGAVAGRAGRVAPEAAVVDLVVAGSAGQTGVSGQARAAAAGCVAESAVVREGPTPELVRSAGPLTESRGCRGVVGRLQVGHQRKAGPADRAVVGGRPAAGCAELVAEVAACSRAVEVAACCTRALRAARGCIQCESRPAASADSG